MVFYNKKGKTMNFKYLVLLAAVVAIPAFAKIEKAKVDEDAVVMTQDANPALANEECPDMPAPMLEHAGTKCKVREVSPAHCFKVIKHITREDLYKINDHSRNECTICDDKGCRPCCGDKLSCGCTPKCEKRCVREKTCPRRCEKRCNRCEK